MSDTSTDLGTSSSVGEAWARTIAERDVEGLMALLADEVSFVGLTPRRMWEAATPEEVATVVFDSWFEESDRIETARTDPGEAVGDLGRVGYRFEITNPDGPHVVEQQAYFHAAHGRIDYLRIVCSGFRPRT
jgi:hypothetical protein